MRAGQLVAGELLMQKAVERLVGVEGSNDVIAILEGPSANSVLHRAPFAVGIAGGVEPVTGPALAVVGRSEQAINQLLVGVVRFVRQKLLGFFRSGGQAQQVKVGPQHERSLVGVGRELQSGGH
jgi:hypothetical protein